MFGFIGYSAFDTLAKALNPPDAGQAQSQEGQVQCVAGATIQLLGRDQETPLIEVEGPLLTDTHVGFKVENLTITSFCLPKLSSPPLT